MLVNNVLSDILFREPTEDGEVLFKNRKQLADAVQALPNSPYSHGYVASLVTTAINGDKALPVKLQEAIVESIRQRLSEFNESIQKRWTTRFEEAVQAVQIQRSSRGAKDSSHDLTPASLLLEMTRLIRVSAMHVVVTDGHPGELIDCEVSWRIREAIVDRILGELSGEVKIWSRFGYSYSLCVGDERYAHYFWIAFCRSLCPRRNKHEKGLRQMSPEEAIAVMRKLDERGLVKVFSVPPESCQTSLHAIVAEGVWTGFNLYYHPNEEVSVAKLQSVHLMRWEEAFWNKIYFREGLGKRYRWAEAEAVFGSAEELIYGR